MASDLKCLKIQVICDNEVSKKHLLQNIVNFLTQPNQPLRSSLFWDHRGLFLPILNTSAIAKAYLNHFMKFSETASDDLKMALEVKSNCLQQIFVIKMMSQKGENMLKNDYLILVVCLWESFWLQNMVSRLHLPTYLPLNTCQMGWELQNIETIS